MPTFSDPRLISPTASPEDAAVYLLDERRALIFTTDFFTPVVDDPFLFGRIAAVNALSDVYAMGGTPSLALNVTAFPVRKYRLLELGEILKGAAAAATEAGCLIAGGHTIDDNEPKSGLCVIGFADRDALLTKDGSRPGDGIFLTKPIGTGIAATAIKNDIIAPSLAEEVVASMSSLNRAASSVAVSSGLKGATDITGYGLLGHLMEMCSASGTGAEISFDAIPFFPGTRELAEKGVVPGGTKANLSFVLPGLDMRGDLSEPELLMAADAQTSGGLLLAVPRDKIPGLESAMRSAGQFCREIGRFNDRSGKISLAR